MTRLTDVVMLTEQLPDLGAWTEHFVGAEVPVLAETADALESLRTDEDTVDAHRLAEVVSNDPLMTLKVLAFAGQHRGSRVVTDVETVIEALVMMGISPFFRAFGAQPKVEEWLAEYPEALAALLAAMRTAHHRANLALAFAVQRMDPDAATVHSVSLLRISRTCCCGVMHPHCNWRSGLCSRPTRRCGHGQLRSRCFTSRSTISRPCSRADGVFPSCWHPAKQRDTARMRGSAASNSLRDLHVTLLAGGAAPPSRQSFKRSRRC